MRSSASELLRPQGAPDSGSPCGDTRVYLEVEIRRVFCKRCGSVKQERLPWISGNPFYTKRFAFYVGRRCRVSTLQDVAKELALDWKTVKEFDKPYMREQLRRVGIPGPVVIGIDEVSIKRGQTYRIVVSDLLRRRPIWFGGKDRSEASIDQFYQWLGPKKRKRIRLAVMDMWKAFRTSTARTRNFLTWQRKLLLPFNTRARLPNLG